jgi:hypothetical protein
MDKRLITSLAAAALATVAFGAAALAQTPSPSPGGTVTPGTTTTAGTTATRTTVVTGTVTAGATVTGTVGSTTPIPTIVVSPSIYAPGGQGDFAFAHPAFQRVWQRTDRPVAEGKVSRTWFWGPGPNTPGLLEQYNESPLANKLRLVQYFDKSRMEVNNPAADQSQAFFVTNGLLTVELISGFIQVGEKDFVQYHPACIPMSGDFGDTNAPTYFAFQGVSSTQAGDHPAADRSGQRATQSIDRTGKVGEDASKANLAGVVFVHYEAQTKHNIPKVFWDFLNSSGPVYNDQGQSVNQKLIEPWFFASGLPISEPYWAKARIKGVLTDVLIQAYERRALTYVPTNQTGWQVEMANIGQHYFDWRYRNFGICAGTAPTTPTAPVPAPSGTVVPGTGTPGTPAATGTPGTPGTPRATGTAVGTTTATTATPTHTVGPVGGTPPPTVTP